MVNKKISNIACTRNILQTQIVPKTTKLNRTFRKTLEIQTTISREIRKQI